MCVCCTASLRDCASCASHPTAIQHTKTFSSKMCVCVPRYFSLYICASQTRNMSSIYCKVEAAFWNGPQRECCANVSCAPRSVDRARRFDHAARLKFFGLLVAPNSLYVYIYNCKVARL